MVQQNVKRVRRVWWKLGKMLQRERTDSKVAAIFYMVAVQAVLLFGSESRFLLVAMKRTVEGTHTGFLQKIMRNRARRRAGGTWFTPVAEEVR